jgi:hypothetical protein
MSEQKYIKTEKKEDGLYDLYEVYTPQGDMFVKNAAGVFETVITYVREVKEQPVTMEDYLVRYKAVVEQNNGYVEEKVIVSNQKDELNEKDEALDDNIAKTRTRISSFEENLDDEDLLDYDIVSDDEEEDEDDE